MQLIITTLITSGIALAILWYMGRDSAEIMERHKKRQKEFMKLFAGNP
ncbi:hypothetical protein NFC81_12920 [Salinispirillum sp. LH 10-3-1]|uniref:Uncharacterized protein n=1 Tax=Salinispirillum sp. LH 10-3-1 TaxID=2952525 RepID=A0AB38YE19_9GAMM